MKKPILWRDLMSMSKSLQRQLSWGPAADLRKAKELTNMLFAGHSYEGLGNAGHCLPQTNSNIVNTLLLTDKQEPDREALKLATTRRSRGLFGQRKTLYWTAEGQKQHALVLGATGAGMTDAMLTTAINAFEAGKSVFFIDAKGDNSLYAKVFSHLQRSESLADLLVVNLMTGGLDFPCRAKVSHTVDLFGGMNTHELTQWLSFVCEGIFHSVSAEDMVDLHALIPHLAALICAVSDDTTLPIDLNLVASVFTQTGLDDISQNLRNAPFAHLAGQIHSRVWLGNGKTRDKFTIINEHLANMASSYPHVFTPTAELCLPDLSEDGRRFVLVMAPAMEKSSDEIHTIPSCILGSYLTGVAKKSSIENVVEEMAIFNSFSNLMSTNQFARLAKTRGKNVGMVFAGDDNSHKLTFKQLKEEHLLPATTIIMKLETDPLSDEVVRHFNHTYAKGNLSLKEMADQRAGHAVFMDGEQCLPVWMGYTEAKRVNKLFITQRPLKDGKVAPPPARLYSKMLGENMDRVLMDRISEMGEQRKVSLSWCQETIARMLGYSSLHEARRSMRD